MENAVLDETIIKDLPSLKRPAQSILLALWANGELDTAEIMSIAFTKEYSLHILNLVEHGKHFKARLSEDQQELTLKFPVNSGVKFIQHLTHLISMLEDDD